jgi:GTPase SAR1 family protein
MEEQNKLQLSTNNEKIIIKSEFSILELGKNMIKTSFKKTDEKILILIGNRSSGKTTILNTILQSNLQKENYTPTCGINYNFMRYQPNNNKKYILNLYEIGGGLENINLIRTIISDKNIKNTIFVLSLDFSQPNKILKSLKDYLKELATIIKEIIEEETILEMIENKKGKYRDKNSNDFKRINFFPLELIVVGNKYDCLEKIDLEKIKWTCRVLRFYSHMNALSLLYYKSGDSKLSKILNGLITNMSFSNETGNVLNYTQKNDIQPLFVLYSQDNLNDIGDPKVFQQGSRDMNSLWEDTFYSIFSISNNLNEEDEITQKFEENFKEKYKEARIDEEVQIFE